MESVKKTLGGDDKVRHHPVAAGKTLDSTVNFPMLSGVQLPVAYVQRSLVTSA